MPGRVLPSRNSREAPPPVETWLILSATPACRTAATATRPSGHRRADTDAAHPPTAPPGTRVRDGQRARRERGLFEDAHRAIPEHRLRGTDPLPKERLRRGADVERHLRLGDRRDR